jgi:hypothetical protein
MIHSRKKHETIKYGSTFFTRLIVFWNKNQKNDHLFEFFPDLNNMNQYGL